MSVSGSGSRWWSLAFVVCIAFSLPTASLAGPAAPSLHQGEALSETSPSEFYWTVERKASADCKDYPDVSSFIYDRSDRNRRFFPCQTAAKYGDARIAEWSQKGDIVALYILALKRLPEIDPAQVNGIANFKFTRKETKILTDLANNKKCNISITDPSAKKFLGCEMGLPEAQYILAVCYNRGIIGCDVNRKLAEKYCRKSLDGGYAPAARGCGNVENHRRFQ